MIEYTPGQTRKLKASCTQILGRKRCTELELETELFGYFRPGEMSDAHICGAIKHMAGEGVLTYQPLCGVFVECILR